ncbi:MAG: protein SCO1/2 [Flavobacteriaceae bacterium]|jgi:protein SCO1/2
MKKVMFSIALIAAIAVIGCKNEVKDKTKTEEVALTEYQCPMKCEGDKTYTDKDVKCPVCGMGLTQMEHSDHKD